MVKRRMDQLNQLTAGRRLERLRNEYRLLKQEVTGFVHQSGNDHERRLLNELLTQEYTFLNSSNPKKLDEAIEQLHGISFQILRRTPDFLLEWFKHLVSKREVFNDQLQAKNFIEAGKRYIAMEDYDNLADVNVRLYNLLPQQEKDTKAMQYFTGIA